MAIRHMPRPNLSRSSYGIVIAWAIVLSVGIVNTYFAVQSRQRVVPTPSDVLVELPEAVSLKSLFGGIDNLVLPMASCFIAVAALKPLTAFEQKRATFRLAAFIVGALSVNTLLSALLVMMPGPTLSFVQFFWPSGGTSVALASFAQQRVSGVFNQPGEAGTAYSLGLLLWTYRLRHGVGNLVFEGLTFVLILVGGTLAGSKIFFFLGVPLAIAYGIGCFSSRANVSVRRRANKLAAFAAALFAAALVGAMVVLPASTFQFAQVQMFLSDVQNASILEAFSGGRYGGSSAAESVVSYYSRIIMSQGPVFGLGFGSLAAFDSAYIQILAFAGLTGLACYAFALGCLVLHFVKYGRNGLMGTLVCILIVAGGLGMPMFTLNRTGTLLVLTVTFLWVHARGATSAEPIAALAESGAEPA
jgi:hypothetical protein